MTTADTRAPAPASTTGTPAAAPPGDSGRALLARLEVLRERVAALVEHRTADDPTADDPLRGLYLPDEAVHHLLRTWPSADADGEPAGAGGPGEPVPAHAPAGLGDRLARLAEQAGLTELDTSALLVALAPDVDRTFEPLYGYLNNDVSRRRATVGLALDLCGVPAHVVTARARFHASAPLRALGLLEVEEPERPFLTRSLRIPDRLVGHLLGDDTPDAALLGLLLPMPGPLPAAGGDTDVFVRRLAARLKDGPLTAYLREPREGDGLAALATVLDAAGIDALRCTAPEDHVPELLREARLGGRAIVVSGLPEKPGPFVRALTAATDVTVLMTDPRPYDPHWAPADPLVLDAPGRRAGGVAVWRAALGADADGFDLATAVA
ncbi:ATP-binding protein, partial [Streptomyces anthocyanicus]